MLEVDEVSYLPEKSNVSIVALMEDEQTKERHQVEMTLVPKSPEQSANGNLIALMPYIYRADSEFLDSESDLSLVNSSFEKSVAISSKSNKMLNKAKLLKKKLYPASPEIENCNMVPGFSSSGQIQIDTRPPLSAHDNWITEMAATNVEPLGPEYENDFQELNESRLQDLPTKSLKLIEKGKILFDNMLKDLEILKTMDSARTSKEYFDKNINFAPNQYIDNLDEPIFENEFNETSIADTVQQLTDFLQPLIPLPIESFLRSPPKMQLPTPEINLINLLSPPRETNLISLDLSDPASLQHTSSSLNHSVLTSTLNILTNESAIIRQQVDASMKEMECQIRNSNVPIPEFERALDIARCNKEQIEYEPMVEQVSDTNQTMIALVENPETGERKQILVDLVPTSPSKLTSNGHIVGYMEDEQPEDLYNFNQEEIIHDLPLINFQKSPQYINETGQRSIPSVLGSFERSKKCPIQRPEGTGPFSRLFQSQPIMKSPN